MIDRKNYYWTSWWLNDSTDDYNPWTDLSFYIPMLPLMAVLLTILLIGIWSLR